jgi:hypothetical protein
MNRMRLESCKSGLTHFGRIDQGRRIVMNRQRFRAIQPVPERNPAPSEFGAQRVNNL